MRPILKYKGGLYNITSLWFDDEGKIKHISFRYLGALETIFSNEFAKEDIIWEESQ